MSNQISLSCLTQIWWLAPFLPPRHPRPRAGGATIGHYGRRAPVRTAPPGPVPVGAMFGHDGACALRPPPPAPCRWGDDWLAPSKLGKGGKDVTDTYWKPFSGTLRVESPSRRADQHLEASLAWRSGNVPDEA